MEKRDHAREYSEKIMKGLVSVLARMMFTLCMR